MTTMTKSKTLEMEEPEIVNTYIEKATGRRLSHAEVLQRIRTYNGY